MCMARERKCKCGLRSASFHFKDNILPEQVVLELFCPDCGVQEAVDPSTMIRDNGWLIQYNMEVAQAAGERQIPVITPAALFDEGYCTWNGMYPGDHIDSVREREQITQMARTNPIEYIRKLRFWAVDRAERLRHEGWRKAQSAA
jgi:hypothetical protein